MTDRQPITIVRTCEPGAIGWIVAQHGTLYDAQWRLGTVFEAKVAQTLGELIQRFDARRDLFLLARDAEGPLGGISVDGSGTESAERGARIRFFIVTERAQGRGVGARLLDEALAFIDGTGEHRTWLTTFAGLDAARSLYERRGFRLAHEIEDRSWGTLLLEQRFERVRSAP